LTVNAVTGIEGTEWKFAEPPDLTPHFEVDFLSDPEFVPFSGFLCTQEEKRAVDSLEAAA
jgi:hypothetical protein